MEQIELEQLKLLARKAQLNEELAAIDKQIDRLAAFKQGYVAAAPKTEEPTE